MEDREMLSQELMEKLEKLKSNIRSLGSVAVAFSGGVDSALLLAAAHEALGDQVLAVTAGAVFMPERELEESRAFCAERGIRHLVCTVDPMQEESFRFNRPDRCYHCKRRIFSEIIRIAGEQGAAWVAEGSNVDDLGDYRPGLRAIAELGIKSPLREAGLRKEEIRMLAKAMRLPVWNKPAYACLASRFVYGEEITGEKLHMVEMAEQFLISHGFVQERVRLHGTMARIELPREDIPRLASGRIRDQVCQEFYRLGFSYVSLDLEGYRTGAMNKTAGQDLPC